MGRGYTSKCKLNSGELMNISCPCGWETSFHFKDSGLCERMAKRAKRNHKKVCPQINDFDIDYCGESSATKEYGVASIKNNAFKQNQKDLEAKKRLKKEALASEML